MTLLETWEKWSEQDPLAVPDFGYVLEDDAKFLRGNHREWQKKLFTYKDWKESNTGEKFGGNRLHLGLVPNPFMGDVENASIYVLMANPRSWPASYTDRDLSGVNKEFLANARQDFTGMEVRFSSLADQSDRNGYWHGRLKRTIERIEKEKKLSYPEAFKQVANKPGRHPAFPLLEHQIHWRGGEIAVLKARFGLCQGQRGSPCSARKRHPHRHAKA